MGGFTVIREGLLISHGAFALMGDFNFHVEKKQDNAHHVQQLLSLTDALVKCSMSAN